MWVRFLRVESDMYLDMQKQNFVLGLRKGLHTGVFFPLKRKLEMLRQSSLQ